jgi:hypothetical protein
LSSTASNRFLIPNRGNQIVDFHEKKEEHKC